MAGQHAVADVPTGAEAVHGNTATVVADNKAFLVMGCVVVISEAQRRCLAQLHGWNASDDALRMSHADGVLWFVHVATPHTFSLP